MFFFFLAHDQHQATSLLLFLAMNRLPLAKLNQVKPSQVKFTKSAAVHVAAADSQVKPRYQKSDSPPNYLKAMQLGLLKVLR
jgi:hypothetical protein